MELTLSIIKPDAVKRNLIGEINSVFTTGVSAPFSGIFLFVVKLLTTYWNEIKKAIKMYFENAHSVAGKNL